MASKGILTPILVLLVTLSLQSNNKNGVNAQLNPYFYATSCPGGQFLVDTTLENIAKRNPQVYGSVLRLFFLDCFVNGCDASILLKDTPTFTGEQSASQIRNTLRGLDAIDEIKQAVESFCPGVVSCADILMWAARFAVRYLPSDLSLSVRDTIKLGRRDATTASLAAAESSIPSHNSSLSELISSFQAVGLTQRDMVTLSGAHTIGRASCMNFRERIYNETNIDSGFATLRKGTCPSASGSGDGNLAPLDVNSATTFDNNYFKNLVAKKGLLHSDQQLYSGGSTNSLVNTYSLNPRRFRTNFIRALIKMGDIKPLTGTQGEIRKVCSRIN